MSNPAKWLFDFGTEGSNAPEEGLVPIRGYKNAKLLPEEFAVMEKAEHYEAVAVFFEDSIGGKPRVAQAFVYRNDGAATDDKFAAVHQKLWSWGGVPLVYRVSSGLVQLFRCAHKPDFEKNGNIILNPFSIIKAGAKIAADKWWDAERIRNGTLWDDPAVCKKLLSSNQAAQKTLINEVKALYRKLDDQGILPKSLRRKLLILTILIAYLEARGVFEKDFFSRFLPNSHGEKRFFDVLANGPALLNLLEELEERFNGHVFTLINTDRESLRSNTKLGLFARLVEGREEVSGQLTLWQRYSFADLPVELISNIYQLFVKDPSAVYTPHFVVRMMLGEVLSWERLDRLKKNDEVILDGACGSGIFLVEAYKRLVLHWRSNNKWEHPDPKTLRELLEKRLRGVDLDPGAVELTAFSLCLALCDALEPIKIRKSVKLFPELKEKTIHSGCFFEAKEQGKLKDKVGVIVGNPPFDSKLTTGGEKRAVAEYERKHGTLPDTQLAYLFLHESMKILDSGGILSMLQPYGFLYNQKSLNFRREFFETWSVREILDFISVRGLFQKGEADTKVVVVVAEANSPTNREILHATFRRSGRADAEQGFDIDYYDMHWLPRQLILCNDGVWRSDLLGGGRVLGFVDRLRKFRTLEQYAKSQGWDRGEGFIAGKTGNLSPGPHITGQPQIEPRYLEDQTFLPSLKTVTHRKFKSPYTPKRFQAPMLLVREHEDLASRYFPSGYYTYGHKIVGFCVGDGNAKTIRTLAEWIDKNRRTLSALVSAAGTTTFTQRASSVGLHNILGLPSPEELLEISPHEQIIIDDILDYYRDFIRLGEDSIAMKESGNPALPAFNDVFVARINGVYKKNKLSALEPRDLDGVICQPYVFDNGDVDWSNSDELKGKLNALLKEKHGAGININRIARIYDGPFIFLLKPDRLRYWLRSIALRDADETLADLWDQGF